MKRVLLALAVLVMSLGSWGFTPDQYATQVIQKDLPRSLRWFEKIFEADKMIQAEIYSLYQEALPETQVNQQLGISTLGSMERLLLLMEGARYFEQVQKGLPEYQQKRTSMIRVLQSIKDQLDRFQFGEDPQVLLDEWRSLGVADFTQFSTDLVDVAIETRRLLNLPVLIAIEEKVDAEPVPPESEVSGVEMVQAESLSAETASFEKERFNSYVQAATQGAVAEECQSAQVWSTDQAESCQSDDSLECDRSYARQCKKLQ